MKKIIQIVSFLSLALIFGGVSADAQTSVTRVDANIPFDFSIGDKSFEAGKYVLRIVGTSTETKSIELRDQAGKTLQTVFAMSNGNVAKVPELVFDKVGGQRALTKISIENAGYTVAVSSEVKQIAANGRKAEGAVKN